MSSILKNSPQDKSPSPYTTYDKFPEGEPAKIAEGFWVLRQPMLFNPGHINCYLLEGENGLIIVDTGIPLNEAKTNWKALFKSPLAAKGIDKIYLTHGHPDHVGCAQWLQEETGAKVLISDEEYDAVQRMWRGSSDHKEEVTDFFMKWSIPAAQMSGITSMLDGFKAGCPDLSLVECEKISENQVFNIGSREWKMVSGWGHTPHNSALYCENDGIMISGDQILPSIYPNISIWWGSEDNPLQAYLDSIQSQKALDVKLVCPAHGNTLESVNQRIDNITRFHLKRIHKAIEFCKGEPKTAFECILPVMNKKPDHFLVSLVAGQVFAILALLEGKGIVERCDDEVFRFKTVLSDDDIQQRIGLD